MKILFIGHFSPAHPSAQANIADSTAGNQVQRQIYEEILSYPATEYATCYSMTPQASWPKGSFSYDGSQKEGVHHPKFINVPILKHIHFAAILLNHMLHSKPNIVIQYNSYLFENLAVIIYRSISRMAKSCIIIQDIHATIKPSSITTLARSIHERAGLILAKYYSLIVPVSHHIINDFGMLNRPHHVVPGGMTNLAKQISESNPPIEKIAVFAGSLSPHNGIDIIADAWIRYEIPYKLHIFGKGPLADTIRKAAIDCTNIQYHGHCEEPIIKSYTTTAQWNICFRISNGIDQRYFFPSKFFNIAVAQGQIITNESFEAPKDLKKLTYIVPDTADGIESTLLLAMSQSSKEATSRRRSHIIDNYSWKTAVSNIIQTLSPTDI